MVLDLGAASRAGSAGGPSGSSPKRQCKALDLGQRVAGAAACSSSKRTALDLRGKGAVGSGLRSKRLRAGSGLRSKRLQAGSGLRSERLHAGRATYLRGRVKRRCFSPGAREWQKHDVFRRQAGLVGTDGAWLLSSSLQQQQLPALNPRALDLLHICWLLLERKGLDPKEVDQCWMLCQSVQRGGLGQCGWGKKPSVPGFSLRSVPGRCAIAPCVLPRCRMWLNKGLRFLLGAELLQLQGVHVQTLCPQWASVPDSRWKSIAGNMCALPCVGWYGLLALVSSVRSQSASGAVAPVPVATVAAEQTVPVATVAAEQLAAVHSEPMGLRPKQMARCMLGMLLQKWGTAVAKAPSGLVITVATGSLCSGPDFAKELLLTLAEELSALPHAPQVQVKNVFACECSEAVWGLRKACRLRSSPGKRYPDVHSLPVMDMPKVDILFLSPMCTSLSRCNTKRSTLADSRCVSATTTFSSLAYVAAQKPPYVILETVLSHGSVASVAAAEAQMDPVVKELGALGYTAGVDLQCASAWGLPQTRVRVYMWAVLRGSETMGVLRHLTPPGRIPLSDCLLR